MFETGKKYINVGTEVIHTCSYAFEAGRQAVLKSPSGKEFVVFTTFHYKPYFPKKKVFTVYYRFDASLALGARVFLTAHERMAWIDNANKTIIILGEAIHEIEDK